MAENVWRINGIGTEGQDLMLSSVRLYDAGVQVDAGAVITSSHVPKAGALSHLSDGDAMTSCTFAAADVAAPGFYIRWDFPVAREISQIVIDETSRVIETAAMECLSAGMWQVKANAWFDLNDSVVLGTNTSTGFFAALLSESPVACFTCSELEGSAVDAVTGAASMSVSSNAVRNQRRLVAGGGSLRMPARNGDSPLLAAADTALGNISEDFSLVVVVRGAKFSSLDKGIIFSKELGGSNWPSYRLDQRDVGLWLEVRSGDSSNALIVATQASVNVLDNQRHLIVFTRSGSQYKVSVDNVLRIDATGSGTPVQNVGRMSVCGDAVLPGFQATPFDGYVGAVAIFNKALSASAVAALFTALGADTARAVTTGQTLAATAAKGAPELAQGLGGSRLAGPGLLFDAECGGQGRIYGTVSRKETPANVPLRRRVRLHRSKDGYLARETWSKADGSYEFREISTRYEWDVIAWDHELQEYSTVANNQLAEVA